MKRILYLILLFSIQKTSAQDKTSVEKSIFGIQTGYKGTWIYNESRLTDKISLRSEIGIDKGVIKFNTPSNSIGFITVIILEPRLYYNLKERIKKGKKTANNSGNFFAFNIRYNHDWFYESNNPYLGSISTLAFIPKWGIRRFLGKHFSYESGIGIGGYIVTEKYNVNNNIAVDLHVRIGYDF